MELKSFISGIALSVALFILFLLNVTLPERRVIEVPKEVTVTTYETVYTDAQKEDIKAEIEMGIIAQREEILAECSERADKESLSTGEYIGLKLLGF